MLCINYVIIMCINNNNNNNNAVIMVDSKTYFVLQTFHWHARGCHRNLWTIWARAPQKKGGRRFATPIRI